MSNNREESAMVLGLEAAADRRDAEYDLVKALLEASDFRNDKDSITEVEIRRKGKYLFSVHLHPLGDDEVRLARKHATSYTKNPQGPKYPQIEKGFDATLFNSWLIYLATTEEDQEKIWGNTSVKDKCGLVQNVETIDAILRFGEKSAMLETVSRISGLDSDDAQISEEELAKK